MPNLLYHIIYTLQGLSSNNSKWRWPRKERILFVLQQRIVALCLLQLRYPIPLQSQLYSVTLNLPIEEQCRFELQFKWQQLVGWWVWSWVNSDVTKCWNDDDYTWLYIVFCCRMVECNFVDLLWHMNEPSWNYGCVH